jgi:hypothetical protein
MIGQLIWRPWKPSRFVLARGPTLSYIRKLVRGTPGGDDEAVTVAVAV